MSTAYPSGAPEFTPGFLVGFVLLDRMYQRTDNNQKIEYKMTNNDLQNIRSSKTNPTKNPGVNSGAPEGWAVDMCCKSFFKLLKGRNWQMNDKIKK
jgi:hypothetical protein